MKMVWFFALTFLLTGCSEEAPRPKRTLSPPGPVHLKSEQQMLDFLVSGRFSGVGHREDWWEFHEDGTFQAQLVGEKLIGEWTATKTELMLTTLKVTNQDGVMKHAPDRRLKLDWQDGKLNINIEDEQYRKYR